MKKLALFLLFLLLSFSSRAAYILIPMDAESQENHLKAYGITYWVLTKHQKVKWLLNYRGGSFLMPDTDEIRQECRIRGVSFEVISDAKTESMLNEIESPSKNQAAVVLEKATKNTVYNVTGNSTRSDA